MIEILLKNRTKIRSEVLELDDNNLLDLESNDEFNDLILIEKKIEELYKDELLSDFDIEVIDYMSDGKPLSESKEYLGKGKQSISKHFSSICKRIGYFLGGHFTDEGFINEIAKNKNLTKEQIDKARKFMSSSYKYNIKRTDKI